MPRGLQAELRAYQHQGLSWMQFLREHNLAGMLADDMGLGKTVQTLAHVLAEKEAGRLDRPALIVVPTTLMHNWREEAHRFAPDLKVLDLNGPQRKERFEQIGEHDLILTTYALLWRDQAVLRRARVSPADPRRSAVRQERHHQSGDGDPRPAGAAPPVPHRHAARESPRRIVGAVRFPAAGFPRHAEGFHQTLAHADRAKRRRRAARSAGAADSSLHAAPTQGRGRERTAAEDHHRAHRRSGRRAARPVRNRPRGDAAKGACRRHRTRARAQSHHRARCAAQAAPGLLRSAPRQAGEGARVSRNRPSWNCCSRCCRS